jgi:hypothetical protein
MLRTFLSLILLLLTISGYLVRADAAPAAWDLLRLQRIDLDVDANRDGLVDERDVDEDSWTLGAVARGAIVLANSDDDDGDHLPDNWTGGDFDYLAGEEAADERVNAFPDEQDLAPLLLHKPGLAAFPPGARIVLRVVRPAQDEPTYAATAPQDRVRIFLPSRSIGNDLVVQAGDHAVIGPEAGDAVEFVAAPGPLQRDIALLAGQGALRYGVEGLRYNALVDIIVEAWHGPVRLGQDRVRMRVAPFLLADSSQPVSREPGLRSVYVEDLGAANEALRATLRGVYGAEHLAETNVLDRWQQDGYEIGYSQAPYGAMWVVLGLPRGEMAFKATVYGAVEPVLMLPGSRTAFEPYRMSNLNHFARQHLLSPGVGLIADFQGIGFTGAEAGGNLEAIPGPSEAGHPGRYLYGSQMRPEIINFLEAQGLRRGMPVDTSLLAVGHVDELLSYCSDGVHVLVVDPEVAWALLLIANNLDPRAEMLQGMLPNATGSTTVGQVVSGALPVAAGALSTRDYNLRTIMAPDRLPALWAALGIGSAASTPVADASNRGMAVLSRAGGLVGFMPPESIRAGRVRTFAIAFQDTQRYTLAYRDDGSDRWLADGDGAIDEDVVSTSRTAFVFANGWQGGAPQAGDRFTFTVDPTIPWVHIPVLYRDGGEGEGIALTGNHVNALVDGETIITARAHGPLVDLGEGPVDILAYYVARELERAGYRQIVFVDDLAYHSESGSVHCATNVFRELPDTSWWD